MWAVLSRVSQSIDSLRLLKHVFVDTSVLHSCCYAFVIPIFEYCSPMWWSAAECHLQLLERQVYSVARFRIDQNFLSCHRRHVDALCMLYKVNSDLNHRLFSELPSALFDIPVLWLQLLHFSLKYQCVDHLNLRGVFFVFRMTFPTLCLTPRR